MQLKAPKTKLNPQFSSWLRNSPWPKCVVHGLYPLPSPGSVALPPVIWPSSIVCYFIRVVVLCSTSQILADAAVQWHLSMQVIVSLCFISSKTPTLTYLIIDPPNLNDTHPNSVPSDALEIGPELPTDILWKTFLWVVAALINKLVRLAFE